MASAILRPDGTATNQWTTTNAATAHEALDDAVTQPTAGSEADGYVATTGNNSTVDLNLATVTVQSASQLVAWIEARNATGGDENILLEIRDAAGTVLASTTVTPAAGTYGWHSLTLGSQSWTQTDVDGLRIAATAKKVGGGAQTELRIRAAYGDLTYTAAALTIVPPLLSAPATVSSPTVVQQVKAAHLSASATVLSPTVVQRVAVPALTAAATVLSPAVTVGAATVAAQHLSATATVATPTVVPGAVTVVVPLVSATATVHDPRRSGEAQTVAVPLLYV